MPPTDPALDAVVRLLARQSSTIHAHQALDLGFEWRRIRARHTSGHWLEHPARVFTVAGTIATPQQATWRWYLAVRFGRRRGVDRQLSVARRAAAALLGWPLPPGHEAHVPEIIVPAGTTLPATDEAEFVESTRWDERRFVRVGEFRVTAPADTLVDLAAVIGRDDLFTLVQAELWRRPAARRRLVELCRPGVQGAGAFRSILTAIGSGIDSPMHEGGHGLLRAAGMPRPECGGILVPGTGAVDCAVRRPRALRPPFGAVVQWDGSTHWLVASKRRVDRVRPSPICGTT